MYAILLKWCRDIKFLFIFSLVIHLLRGEKSLKFDCINFWQTLHVNCRWKWKLFCFRVLLLLILGTFTPKHNFECLTCFNFYYVLVELSQLTKHHPSVYLIDRRLIVQSSQFEPYIQSWDTDSSFMLIQYFRFFQLKS